ncbi:hypothetical protein ACFLXI_04710 [Chloroflexota bacterium]
MSKYLFPKIQDILFITLLIAVLLYGPRTFNLDGDLGRHITIGDHILDTITIPRFDLFSHTMTGQPLTPHEWLAQVAFALSHRALGLSGAVLITGLIIAISFVLVFREGVRRSSSILISLAVTFLAAATASLHWLSRPHVFTFLFLAIWVSLHERVRCGKKTPLWSFGLVMLLWANTHGAFISGFVIWGAYLGGEILEAWQMKHWPVDRFRNWMLIGVLSFAVTFINPAGLHLWETSFGFVSNRYLVSHTQEYLPPFFHNSATWPFLIMLTLMTFILALKKGRLPFTHSLLISGWSAMALYSTRNIPLFAIVVAPILSVMAADVLSEVKGWQKIEVNILQTDQKLKGGLWIGVSVLLVAIFSSTPGMQIYNTHDASVFPVAAVDWIDESTPEGNVFNHFPWGGYLLYRRWPDSRVFIDGQTDFYGEALTREYEQVITMDENWEQILEKYQVDWMLVPEGSILAEALNEQAGWQTIYKDDTAVILKKGD